MDKSTWTFAGHDTLCVDDPIQFGVSAAQRLLWGKRVIIMGCSVQRDLYKDIVLLLQEQRYLTKQENKVKGPKTVVNDILLDGGIFEELKNDPLYREVREYRQGEFHVRFYFITKSFNSIVWAFVHNIYADFHPDVFFINSAIWDVNRGGIPFDRFAYKQNVRLICKRLVFLFSSNCRLIWLHQPPVTQKCSSGGIVQPADREVLKFNVLQWIEEAVCIAENVAKQLGFETIDLYHLMKHRLNWIAKDGVHWASEGYRCMSLLVFHKLSDMYNIPLPEEGVQYEYP
ncbi:PC-esterase domain-containing protein 1B-like [Symsagittifera roscoffensis]|uniref:PC-esterase domain-containing protein 1B-like n=1 Tax=Symsagittifera roscoffensis TaxID=84072 RepID=UPI00307C04F4